jgi:large subunit ribosomal protein L22
MGKAANKTRTKDNEARAFLKHIRTSPQKLNLVASMIRGKSAEKAMTDLEFCNRRVAEVVRKVLQSAVANAENNHNLDIDSLVVSEAYVGKTMVMKRFRARARGRVGRIQKPFSNLTVVVKEKEEQAAS